MGYIPHLFSFLLQMLSQTRPSELEYLSLLTKKGKAVMFKTMGLNLSINHFPTGSEHLKKGRSCGECSWYAVAGIFQK